jgi:subfamily B ATP-binding cassette protein MsbA
MKSLLRLKPYLRPFVWLIAGSAVLAVPLAALRASPALIIKYAIDDALKAPTAHKLLMFAATVLGIYLVNFVVRFFHYYFLRIVIARVNQKLKNDLFEHLLGLSSESFTTQSNGSLIARVTQDTHNIDIGLACINILIREPITFLFLLGYALHLNWRLTLITFLIFPPLAFVFSATGRNIKRYIRRMQESNATIFSTLQETFTGIRVIKTFRLEKYVRKKFRERAENYTKFQLKTARLEEAAHPIVELLTAFTIAGVVYYGGLQIMHGEMTQGDLIAFFATFAFMMDRLRDLNDVNMKLNQAAASCERIFEVFDWRSKIQDPPMPKELETLKQGIQIDGVSFAYPDAPSREILRNVSFDVKKGQIVALVGASGAGKSSLISLLPRLFDVNEGAIRIDGTDIRQFRVEDVRKLIAVVSQDVFLFNDTIEENIRCGRLSATRAEVREAARRAHAADFIEQLPDGYQAIVGDRGQKLSGGERQRISIARAFLREAPILILDEATSSLDTASERAVQEALDELMINRTTLVIAHRLSTIRHADHIIVLKQGEIVEEGVHDELLKKGGEYAHFHQVHQS